MPSDLRKIPMLLRAAYLAMHRQTNARIAALELTADQFVCLAILGSNDGIIQRELVERAMSDQNTVSAMLLLLEKKGYVSRHAHSADKRARLVRLTAKGRTVLEKSHAALNPVHRKIQAQVSEEEARVLTTLLARLSGALQ